jgi:uncharacterized DUF497 family protein
MLEFEWSAKKAAINLKKHKVSFEEAATVFDDPCFVDFYDDTHSQEEDRYLIIGMSGRDRLLIVSYTEPALNTARIINARRPTKLERRRYEEDQS